MTNTSITQLTTHPVHIDPIDAAMAALADASLTAHLVCDGSCDGLAACTVAPIAPLAAAA